MGQHQTFNACIGVHLQSQQLVFSIEGHSLNSHLPPALVVRVIRYPATKWASILLNTCLFDNTNHLALGLVALKQLVRLLYTTPGNNTLDNVFETPLH